RAARGSRAAGARWTRGSAALPAERSPGLTRPPDFLGRPLPRPLGTGERPVAVWRRAFRRLELDQVLDLEAIRAQQPDPVAVAEVEVDARVVRPLEPVHPEVRPAE